MTDSEKSMENLTSASLLRRIRDESDVIAWEDFAARYYQVMERWLKAQGVDDHDASDIAQEVMVFLTREISRFEHNGRPGAFRNWLRRVTANRMREFFRKRSRHEKKKANLVSMAEDLQAGRGEMTRIWNLEHDRFVLEHLLRSVSDQFQVNSLVAFRKVVLEERPAQEVADELGMSLGAVRVAQSRVLRSLREVGDGLID